MADDPGDGLRDHIRGLRRYAMALVGSPVEADDLVQEALKRALVYIRAGREIRDVRAYLFTVLHNVRVDQVSKATKNGPHVPIDEIEAQLSCPARHDMRLHCRDLSKALACLPAQQREVILLVGLEGLSYRGAAEVLGIPIGTVMSRLNRGRENLRRQMSEGPTKTLSRVE